MVFDKIREIVCEQTGLDLDEITLESSFADDLGYDILAIVDLISAIEDEFKIKIPDSEAERLITVGDVVDYINSCN
ncbi:MAG: acyl carrier protein [Clostridia bacterium]|nr:acyl carrier protein [Clostridia bacterium]